MILWKKWQITLVLHPEVVRTVENCTVCPLTCLKGAVCYFLTPLNCHHVGMSTQCWQTFTFFERSQNLDFVLWNLQIFECWLLKKKPKQNGSRSCQSVFSITVRDSGTSFEELGNGKGGGWHWLLSCSKITDYIKYVGPMASSIYCIQKHSFLQALLKHSTSLGSINRCLLIPASWSPLEFPKCV